MKHYNFKASEWKISNGLDGYYIYDDDAKVYLLVNLECINRSQARDSKEYFFETIREAHDAIFDYLNKANNRHYKTLDDIVDDC